MPAMVETMVSVREVPWHRLGKVVQNDLTAAEALIASGLDWEVALEEVLLKDGTEVPDYRAIVRQTDRRTLGMATPTYQPVQNKALFDFVESLLDAGGLVYETAGSLRGGKEVWCLARVPENIFVADQDPVERFILTRSAHTGAGALKTMRTNVRVVCKNTIELAERSARFVYHVNHFRGAEGRIDEARRALRVSYRHDEEFELEARKLFETSYSESAFEALTAELFMPPKEPEPTKRQVELATDKIGTVQLFWKRDPFTGTGWAAVNAVNEFEQWSKQKAETQARLIIEGMPLTRRAQELVLASR